MRAMAALLLLIGISGCNEATGSGLVEFRAAAVGPTNTMAGRPYEFDNAYGYHLRLDRARLTVGALYLNRSRPTLGAQDTACVLPGVYVAEVRSAVVFDALSSDPVEFGVPGQGIADRALSGEVWLTGGSIDAATDPTRILEVIGTATRADSTIGFHGVVTIGQHRNLDATDPATPSANPLCRLRIVTPIPIDITPTDGGTLLLRVAPEIWFEHVDFAQLPGAVGLGEDLEIPDSNDNAASANLFWGLRSRDAYRFEWQP